MGLHILALHGKQQNGQIFRSRLGQIPRKLKAVATFHIIESPHEMPLEEGDEVVGVRAEDEEGGDLRGSMGLHHMVLRTFPSINLLGGGFMSII